MKLCSKCFKILPATTGYFYQKKGVKCGLTAWCRSCISQKEKEKYQVNPKRKKENARRRRIKIGRNEKKRIDAEYYQKNRTTALAYERFKNLTDPRHQIRKRKAALTWAKQNPRKVYEQQKKRDMLKCRAMPPWVDASALREIYLKCPEGMDVDHIVPITSPIVCGLHVPWNLQYLTPTANREKHNKFHVEFTPCA